MMILSTLRRWTMPVMALVLAFNFVAAPVVHAQSDQFGLNFAKNSGLGVKDPRDTIASLIRVIMGFLGTLAVLLVLYGGFKWMTASGNQEQVEDAKKLLIAGVIGLVIILSAYGIATYVLNQLMSATS